MNLLMKKVEFRKVVSCLRVSRRVIANSLKRLVNSDLFVVANKKRGSSAHQAFLIKMERLKVTLKFLA